MIGKLIGAVAGAKATEHVKGVGGYAYKRYTDKKAKRPARRAKAKAAAA